MYGTGRLITISVAVIVVLVSLLLGVAAIEPLFTKLVVLGTMLAN